MKKFSKNTTIVLSVIICLFLVVGFIFSFVPMTFGSKTYTSLFKSINVSSDLMGGMYGEYDITTEDPSNKDLINSMARIKEVFEKDGYKNVNVYTVGNKKIRVEVSYPTGTKSYSDVYSDLSAVSSGKFLLSSSSTTTAEDVVNVDGAECVKEVKVYTNNGTNYLAIIFNEKGQEQYEALCKKTTTIYLHLGTYNQSITANNVTDYSSFTLSDADYENLIALKNRVVIGCMNVEINSSTAVINTMSASLAFGNVASSPEETGFNTSTVLVVIVSIAMIIAVVGIALFAIKFGLFAVVILISLVINIYLFLFALYLMPSVEIGFSSILSMIMGLAVIYTYTFIFASKVKSEYNVGKTFSASLESAFKKTFTNSLIGNVALFLSALVVFAFSFGELTSAAIIFAVCSFLSILTNFAIIPLLVKVGISFEKIGQNLFMLKKRSLGFNSMNSKVIDAETEEDL
ncbi:MAG: hypothetical protein IJW32_02270 [Clostridia bacterium]|nr:hypothetical protein [Clostridia bacterium]